MKFSPTNEFGIFSRGPPQSGQANCILAIDDDDFVRLAYNVLKLEDVRLWKLSLLIIWNNYILFRLLTKEE